MNEPLTGIVILNWNGLDLIKACLDSIEKQTYTQVKIIVIDNGSSDGSLEWLRTKQNINLISNRRNLGFAKAINQGIDLALKLKCIYVIALNNDTVMDKNWIKSLVGFMDENQQIDFAQGATMQQKDHTKFDSTGIYLERGFIPKQRALDKNVPELNITAIGPNAAGSIYRANLLKAVAYHNQYFDERFFAYVEDVDFNLRCTLRGYKFGFNPTAKIYHKGSITGNKIANKKMYWGARNMVWLVYKNASLAIIAKTFKPIIKSHIANIQFLWKQKRQQFLPYLCGLFIGTLTLPWFISKRHDNLKKQTLNNESFLNLLVASNPPVINPLRKLTDLIK